MRKNLGAVGTAIALGLAGITGTAQATQPLQANTHVVNEMKSTPAKHSTRRQYISETIGGLEKVTYLPDFGMSPKEYGMRYGNGKSKKGKTNFLRLSHNAKLKRR